MVLVTPARSAVFAQQSLAPLVPSGASPISYPERYAEVMGLAGDRTQIAEVNNLVLTRDLARFTLTSGRLYLLTPVGGRIVGGFFKGRARSPLPRRRSPSATGSRGSRRLRPSTCR